MSERRAVFGAPAEFAGRAAWLVVLLSVLVAVGSLLPRPIPGTLLFIPAQVAILAVLAFAVGTRPLQSRGAWIVIVAGLAITAVSMLPIGLGQGTFVDLTTSPWRVVGYLIVVAGGLGLIRESAPEADRATVIEALILATAAGTVTWFVLVQPRIDAGLVTDWPGAIIALGYPAVDSALLVLAGLTGWQQRGLSVSQWLIVLALVANTATNTGVFHDYTWVGYRPGQPSDLGLVLVLPLLAGAVLHPSSLLARRIRTRPRTRSVLGLRLVALSAALFIPPSILLVTGVDELLGNTPVATPTGMPNAAMALAFAMFVLVALVALRLLSTLARLERVLRARDTLEGDLKRQALSDGLTLLPNRVAFGGQLEQVLAREPRPAAAVLFLDLDDFKTINDTLGHAAGDELLVAAAARLRNAVRPADLAARLGGDEFAVLLTDLDSPDVAETVAARILEAFALPFSIGGTLIPVRLSIGVAVADDAARALELMQDADIAMYLAKNAGKARAVRFEPSMRTEVAERMAFQTDLASALERAEFRLVYQPITSLAGRAVVGAEALVRWDHPTRGTVAPLDFVPQAERTGYIVPLGRWVLMTACRQMRAWLDAGAPADAHISVNVSPVQLVQGEFAEEVREILRATGLAPANLMLEITESALVDPEAAGRVLKELKGLGLRIAVDDFGTGYSAMSYLATFPIDVLKIDRSFIAAMSRDEQGRQLVRTILRLASNLELDTIAEGIEDDGQLATLVQMGCGFGQGFRLGRPVDPETVGALLAEAPGARRRQSRRPAATPKASVAAR